MNSQQKLRDLVRDDLVYENFKIIYAPFWVTGDFTLKLVADDDETGERGSKIVTLPFDFQVKRPIHCLVVVEPEVKAVIVESPANFKTTAIGYVTKDLNGEDVIEVKDHGQHFELTGVQELFEACSKAQKKSLEKLERELNLISKPD